MKFFLIITLFFSFAFTACSVNKRDTKTPVPSIKKVSTDFFFEFSKDRNTYKSKRFLYGTSVEDRTGKYASILPLCNS